MIDRMKIEKKALSLRQEHNVQTYGIKDIFSLIEQMDMELIRYPFGKDVVCGLSTIFEGKRVLVSNSSEILSREIFTIAHELGHLIFDFESYNQDVKVDLDISSIGESISEKRADYFAACFLMPKAQIEKFVEYELKKEFKDLRGLDIVRIQIEFNMSYRSTVIRLKELGFINDFCHTNLLNEQSMYSSSILFKMINADERLINPTGIIKVPAKYLEYVITNYQQGYIPFSSLVKAFELIGVDPQAFRKDASEKSEELPINELFKEFET